MIPDYRIGTLVAGTTLLLFAAVVLAMGPGRRLYRAFSLFLALRSSLYILLAINDTVASLPGRVIPYVIIAIPLAAVNFALVSWQHRRDTVGDQRREARVRWALLAVAAVAMLVYAIDHAAFTSTTNGWLSLFSPLMYMSYAAVAWMLYLTSRDASSKWAHGTATVLVVGFAAEAAYFPTFHVFNFILNDLSGLPVYQAAVGMHAMTVLLIGWLLGTLWVAGDAWRRAAIALSLLTAVAVPAALWVVLVWDPFWLFTFDTFFHVVMALSAGYATLRFDIVRLDTNVKRAVDYGAIAAIFTGVFILASELLEEVIPVDGPVLGVLSATGIALVLRPIHSLTARLADRLMPEVDGSDKYQKTRRKEILGAAIATATWDGPLTPNERAALVNLAESLGFSETTVRRMERSSRRT